MRLRLWHAPDGARVAYREAGAGPALVLLHSALLTHREWEPVVEHLTHHGVVFFKIGPMFSRIEVSTGCSRRSMIPKLGTLRFDPAFASASAMR